jgi:molybdate/tungstate transport system ATP-binding protein
MLFPHLNVFDNIAFGLKIRRVSHDEIKHRVEEIAKNLGIEKILDRYVDNLSGGEQQRISLARALLLRPGLLLLDEPTSSLDQQTRESLLDLLRRVHRESGVTVVHITHDRQEAIALANRIAIMDMGRVVQVGATDSVFRQPLTDFVARFLGSENIFRGTAQRRESLTEISVGDVKVIASKPAEGEVSITIRPEDIILVQKRAGTSARNVLSGRIVELAEQGALVRVTLDCGVPLVVFVTRQSFIDMELNVGSRIYAYFKAQSVHVF